MSTSKVVPLRLAIANAKARRRKGIITPEFYWRRADEVHLISGERGASYHHSHKMECLFDKYGLYCSIVVDETGTVLSGAHIFKSLRSARARMIPVVVLLGLSREDKIACRFVGYQWREQQCRREFLHRENCND